MVLLQYNRNKSSHLLNRNILCGTLLSDTASEPHKAVKTFLIASESKPQCGAWKTDLNVISSIMRHSHWRQSTQEMSTTSHLRPPNVHNEFTS